MSDVDVIRRFKVIDGKTRLVEVVRKPRSSSPVPISGISFETHKSLAERSNFLIGKNQFDEFSTES